MDMVANDISCLGHGLYRSTHDNDIGFKPA